MTVQIEIEKKSSHKIDVELPYYSTDGMNIYKAYEENGIAKGCYVMNSKNVPGMGWASLTQALNSDNKTATEREFNEAVNEFIEVYINKVISQ